MDHLDPKVSKETQEKLVNPDSLAQWGLVAPLDPLENPAMTVKLENLVNLATVGLLGLRGLVDSLELLVFPASKDTEVIQVLMVQRESLELLEQRERLELPVRAVPLDQWALVVCLAREDVRDPVELLVLVEMMAWPVLLDLQVLLVLPELQVSLVVLVQREKLVLLVPADLRGHRDLVGSQVLLDHLGHLVLLETLVQMVFLELKDPLVLLVLLVPLVSLDLVVPLGHREQLDLLDQKEPPETPVFLGSKVKLARKEKSDQLAYREPMAHRERRASVDLEVSPVLLGHLDLLERGEPQVTVVSQVRMDCQALRVPPVSEDLRAPVGLRAPVVTPDAQENLAFLVPEV